MSVVVESAFRDARVSAGRYLMFGMIYWKEMHVLLLAPCGGLPMDMRCRRMKAIENARRECKSCKQFWYMTDVVV